MGEFHRHVAQSAETDYANFLVLGNPRAANGGIRCYSSTKKRRGSIEVEVGRNAQDKAFIDHDVLGVAAVGDASEVLVGEVVGECEVGTKLFEARPALGTRAVRIYHAADCGKIARFELGDRGADRSDTADDLMAGHAWIDSGHDAAPLVTNLVKIGVTNAAKEDFDLHVAVGWIATFDLRGSQRRCRTGSGVSFRVVRSHVCSFCLDF